MSSCFPLRLMVNGDVKGHKCDFTIRGDGAECVPGIQKVLGHTHTHTRIHRGAQVSVTC